MFALLLFCFSSLNVVVVVVGVVVVVEPSFASATIFISTFTLTAAHHNAGVRTQYIQYIIVLFIYFWRCVIFSSWLFGK